ncbi:response regulator [Emticicia sp. SJ17W-69]|uniref:response regulator n=1 Tax=Emticicia sp. SJ17W-69 TaxID=3421657 RepID=UPI003EC03C31
MKPIHILLVEDNEGDIMLTVDAFEEGKISNNISVVRDGNEAIDFLTQTGKYASRERPDLILLDVNLPKKNGHEVLHLIKTNDGLKHIPVIMLTTSSSENDIEKAYKNFANCYITKPIDVNDFMVAISKIEDFWFSIVSLPNNS